MGQHKIAVVGVGATGTVLAAALLGKYPETVLVGRNPAAGATFLSKGIRVSGVISYQSPVKIFISDIKTLFHYARQIFFKRFSCKGIFNYRKVLCRG